MIDGTVYSSLITSFGSLAEDVIGMVSDVLPLVLPIAGVLILIAISIKIFKRFAK